MARRFHRVALLLLAAFAITSSAIATPCFDYESSTHWVDSADLSWARDVVVKDGYAYVSDFVDGLLVLDRNVSPPAVVATIPTPGAAQNLFLDGSTLYLADRGSGLRIYDLATPTSPAFLGSYPLAGAWDVDVVGTTAYVTSLDSPFPLVVLDVSNPLAPAFLGSVDLLHQGFALAVEGSLAFVAARSGGLFILDVSVPTAPAIVTSDTFGLNSAHAIDAAGDLVYVGGEGTSVLNPGGVRVVDVEDPQNPVLRSSFLGYVEAITLEGNLLLAEAMRISSSMAWHEGLHIVDVTDPDAPVLLAEAPCDDMSLYTRIAVDGTTAYMADANLHVFDFASLASPSDPAEHHVYGTPRGVAASGTLAAVATSGRIEMLDLSGPAPVTIGQSAGARVDVALAGTTVIALTTSGVEVVDVTTPGAPTVVGSVPLAGGDVIVYRAPHAYVAGENMIAVVDCSIPTAPAVVQSLPLVAWAADDLEVVGDRAYAISSFGWDPGVSRMTIFDVAAAGTLTQLGYWESTEALTGVAALSGDRVATVGDRFRIFDVSDPTSPTSLGEHALPGFGTSATPGALPETVLVGTAVGMFIADVTSSSAPTVHGVFACQSVYDIALDGEDRPLLVTLGMGEMYQLPAACDVTPAPEVFAERFRLDVFPNPSTGAVSFALPGHTGDERGERRLDVYDLAGRRLWTRTVAPGASAALRWDGRDRDGIVVPAGVYFVRLESADGVFSRKVTRLR